MTAAAPAATEGTHVYLPLVQDGRSPILPQPTPVPPSDDGNWNGVANWVYQLSGYPNDRLDQIAGSRFDLAVVDLARDGSDDYFTRAEVGAAQATGKLMLAYFEIGAIEDYRPEWGDVPADIRLGAVDGWPSSST